MIDILNIQVKESLLLLIQDVLLKHVLARRLESIEVMILLLGYSICRSSIAVKFLPSILLKVRNKSVKPIYLLQQEEYTGRTVLRLHKFPKTLKETISLTTNQNRKFC